MKLLTKAISTFFYLGYLPAVPGTFGSLAGLGLFYLLKDNYPVYIIFTALAVALGFFTSGAAEKLLRKKDPSCIVIDEVAGMLLALLFLPADIKVVITAFVFFRVLDSLKPYPACQLQGLRGSLGIMSDDITAAMYTNIILQVALRLAVFKIS
ncbi:MAG: phosphatidylglycerophosphatase A [Candidatus Omnitrophota bacterium]